MTSIMPADKPLPGFRRDLRVYPGPVEPDGSPTYNLQDPVKGKYFQFTWSEYLIFERLRPGMTLQELVKNIHDTTTLRVDADSVHLFLSDCVKLGLLAVPRSSESLLELKKSQKTGIFLWILYNYLFMRLPLFNPDKFLSRTLHYVKFMGSSPAFLVYWLIAATGLILLSLRFGEFVNSFSFFFNVEGFFDYFLAISVVKIIHEFSHAYTAKRYKLYVPSMGIALIVLWPVLYTDVTDGWKISNRRHRIYISAAGVIAESVMAGLCTIGWFFTQAGVANNIFFVIASVTWISTLIINLNPAIRFDGYYIFSDWWGVDNLQARTFNVTRWKLREQLLGLKLPCPEPRLSHKQLVGFMVYAIYTIIYRLFLYTAIALFIYHTFTKALGIFLFIVEIGIFILWPIAWEIQALRKEKQHMTFNVRLVTTISVLGLFLAWGIVPLPHVERFPGVVVPLSQQIVYVPEDSLIRQVFVHRGQEVKEGQQLLQLESPALTYQISGLEIDEKMVKKQIDLLSGDDTQRSYIPSKQAELATGEEKIAGLKELKDSLSVKAKISGNVYSWSENLRPGLALPKDYVIGKISDIKNVEIIFFVPEEDLYMVSLHQPAKFIILASADEVRGTVTSIDPINSQSLQYPALASIYKGDVPVASDVATKKLKIVESYYEVRVKIEPTDVQLFFGKSGLVEVQGPWRSKFMSLIQMLARTLWREGSL